MSRWFASIHGGEIVVDEIPDSHDTHPAYRPTRREAVEELRALMEQTRDSCITRIGQCDTWLTNHGATP